MKNRIKSSFLPLSLVLLAGVAHGADQEVSIRGGEKITCSLVEQPGRKKFNLRRCSGVVENAEEGSRIQFETKDGQVRTCIVLAVDSMMKPQSSGPPRNVDVSFLCDQ